MRPALKRPRLSFLGPALEVRDFRLWWVAMLSLNMSMQMVDVSIGWHVYAKQNSTLDLGWIGLAEFLPMFVLAIPAGNLADKVPRRTVFLLALCLGVAVSTGLAVVTESSVSSVLPWLALAVGAGGILAIGSPAARAMPTTLVSAELLPSAMTLRTIASQTATVLGPALGGVLYGVLPVLVYVVSGCLCLNAVTAVARIRRQPAAARPQSTAPGITSVLEGLQFVGRTQLLLGAILLDLVAVLFGGATALLPVFAKSILHVGPQGLGVLRAAPAVGALLAAMVITRRPLAHRVGRLLLTVVGIYGACIVTFGFSRIFLLSLVVLAMSGFADMFSMNIRSTAVALATPDRLRGRVAAVEAMFVSASSQLGAFESGVAATLVGTIPAVVGGGMVTIGVVLAWTRLFPALAKVDRLRDIRPAEDEEPGLASVA